MADFNDFQINLNYLTRDLSGNVGICYTYLF